MIHHDKQRRSRVKLSELSDGNIIEVDAGFVCMSGQKVVYRDDRGLYVLCKDGRHYLDGQSDVTGYLVGMHKVKMHNSELSK